MSDWSREHFDAINNPLPCNRWMAMEDDPRDYEEREEEEPIEEEE